MTAGRGAAVVAAWVLFASSGLAAESRAETPGAPAASPAVAAADPSAASTTLDFANGLYARRMYAPAISEYQKFISENPASSEIASARFRHADSYYFTKNYLSAADYFADFLKRHPGDKRVPMAHFRLGSSRFHLGENEEAAKHFSLAMKDSDDPNVRSGALFYLAKSQKALGREENSLSLLKRVAKEYPQSEYAAYASLELGDSRLKAGALEEAAASYQAAAARPQPREVAEEGWFQLGEIRFRQEKFDEARAAYEKAYELGTAKEGADSRRPESLLGLFYSDFYLKDQTAAFARFERHEKEIRGGEYEPEILYVMAGLLEDAGKKDEALGRLEEALAHPKSAADLKERAIFRKAGILREQGKNESAVAALDSLLAGNAGSARAHYEKGRALEASGHVPGALDEYTKAAAAEPTTEWAKSALYQSALVKQRGNDGAGARQAFTDYAKKYPDDPNAEKALLEAAQIDLDAKDFARAVSALNAFVTERPQSLLGDVAQYKLGIAYTGAGDAAKALAAFEKVASDFPGSKLLPEALYGASLNHEGSGDFARAVALNEKLLSGFPDHPLSVDVLSRLGYLYFKVDDKKRLAQHYTDVLTNRPQVPLKPEEVFWLVQYLLDKGDYAEIQRVIPVMGQRFPERDFSHEIQFFLGESYLGQKDFPKAVEHYKEAARLSPNGLYAPHAHLGMGIASRAMKDSAAARKYLADALKYDFEARIVARARFELANLHIETGEFEEAAKGFMLVAILHDDPKYTPLALYKAGECFLKLDRSDEAQKAFEELKTRYPGSPWAEKTAAFDKPAETAS